MLVLSRHAGETIRIGDDIVISVQRISGNRVILGIEAPREVAVRRGELPPEKEVAVEKEVAAEQPAAAEKHVARSSQPASRNGGTGLAARNRARTSTREADRRNSRPLAVPMGNQTAGWSGSHVSG